MSTYTDTVTAAPATEETAPEIEGKIVAFIGDDDTTTALRMGLLRLADELDLRRGGLRQAIRYFEKDTAARAVIVDIADEADPQFALDGLARVCPPDIHVIIIGDNTDICFYRLMVNELGVAEYLPKPLTRDTVQRLLLPRLTGEEVESLGLRGGHVVAVCGASGGAGASTLAVNLAIELATGVKGHVALLDLHLQGGTTALMLSARPGPGLRIALEQPERADALFLERTAITVETRLRLVAAEEGHATIPAVNEAGVRRVLDLLRQKFNFVVVDLPVPLPPAMRPVIDQAREVVVVFGPDVAGLRDAKAMRQLITSATGSDRIVTVLNRADASGGLPLSMIRQGLGGEPDLVLPDLGKRMLQAVNLGVPAVRRVPALRKHLRPLIREVAGLRNKAGRSWLPRVFRP